MGKIIGRIVSGKPTDKNQSKDNKQGKPADKKSNN